MSETIHTARCRHRACRRTMTASMIVIVVMTVPLNTKACADHAAPSRYDPAHHNVPELEGSRRSPPPVRAQSVDERSPDPFDKRFPPPRAADLREQPLVDQASRSMSRSIFEMPSLMSDTQRDDPRRTGRLEWTSPLPPAPENFGKRLRERDGDPDTR